MAEGFASDFKRFFLRGLAAVLPTVLTLIIIVYVFKFVHNWIGVHINTAIKWSMGFFISKPTPSQEVIQIGDMILPKGLVISYDRYFWWVGFILAVVAIYIFGRFVASFLGRGAWRMTERTLLRTPVVRAIYPYVKQVTDFLFSEKKIEFSRVVAVEYPRKGVWSLGLVTGAGMRSLQNVATRDLLTVFVPSSPTPFTGYTITVRRDEVIDLPISIDDALRFSVSGGVIMPGNEQLSKAETEQARQGVFPMLQRKEASK